MCRFHYSFFTTQKREVNTVLADVIKHMTPDRAFEDAYPQVKNLFCQIYKNLMCIFLDEINFLNITDVSYHKIIIFKHWL